MISIRSNRLLTAEAVTTTLNCIFGISYVPIFFGGFLRYLQFKLTQEIVDFCSWQLFGWLLECITRQRGCLKCWLGNHTIHRNFIVLLLKHRGWEILQLRYRVVWPLLPNGWNTGHIRCRIPVHRVVGIVPCSRSTLPVRSNRRRHLPLWWRFCKHLLLLLLCCLHVRYDHLREIVFH